MYLFNNEPLTSCFHQLDKSKASGIDKASYGTNLDGNIQGLLKKMKDMAYRPGPVREALISKEGMPV